MPALQHPRSETARARWRRAASRTIVAVLLLAFTCVYRFNTLGGRFGGFDNDHFVPFAYAKQVQAGEQPLRDFEGLGLQGAWPSLTYEMSALMQRWFGDNLRSEAVLTVAGVGIAAALTFLAAASLAPLGSAAAATLVSVFVAPTLYNYTKVLILSAAALTIAQYCRRRHVFGVVAGSVVTAAAFLLRHDLAVYAGVGLLIAYGVASEPRERIRRTALYVALTLLLLTPSLVWVQRHAGLVRYLRDGKQLSDEEAARTALLVWPRFTRLDESGDAAGATGFFAVEQNGVAWLYYLTRLLPFAAIALIWVRRGERESDGVNTAVLAIAGMTAFAAPLLIRGNVPVRLGDVGPLVAILAAWTAHEAARWRSGEVIAWRAGRSVALLAIVGVTALSTASVGYVWDQLGTAGFRQGWRVAADRSLLLWKQLSTLPMAAIDELSPEGPLDISQYINRCTAPSDRVVTMTYQPELLPFAGRLFGAGRLNILPDFALDSRQEQSLVSRWRAQSVPLAFVEFEEFWSPDSTGVPIVRAYLHEHYAEVGVMPVGDDRVLHVFAERARKPAGTFGPHALPCFR